MVERTLGQDLLCEEVARALGLEDRLHGLVSRQLADPSVLRHAEATDWLRRLEPRVHAHRTSLASALHRLDAPASRVRRAVGGALDGIAEWTSRAGEVPGPALTRDLREAYALLSATAASYVIVATTADAVGENASVVLAQEHADDANGFLDELALLILRLTRDEALAEATPSRED